MGVGASNAAPSAPPSPSDAAGGAAGGGEDPNNLTAAEFTSSVLLSLPRALRAPFDEYLATTLAAESVALADAIEDIRANALRTLSQHRAATSPEPFDDEELWQMLGRAVSKFGSRSGAAASALSANLREAKEELRVMGHAFVKAPDGKGGERWVSAYPIDPSEALRSLSSARLVIIRMFAHGALARFARSELCKRLEAELRAYSPGALELRAQEWAFECTGTQLADALASTRAGDGAPRASTLPLMGAAWEADAAEKRATWLARFRALAEKLPCMVSVSDMRKQGALCVCDVLGGCALAPSLPI